MIDFTEEQIQRYSRPSQEDLRLANDPTIRYAILSLLDGEPKLNSFKILNGEVVDKEIHL